VCEGIKIITVPYGGGKRLMEEKPSLGKDIETFIKSLGYQDSERIRVTAPKAKFPPTNDFGKPHTLLLTNPLAASQPTSYINRPLLLKPVRKRARRKLPSMPSLSTKTCSPGSSLIYQAATLEDDYSRMSALATNMSSAMTGTTKT